MSLLRLPYSLLWYVALPAVLLRLAWRARRQPAYLQHVDERFASYRAAPTGPVVWIHAVSVGETRAAEPLVRAVLERLPDHEVLLTHMTPTGRDTAASLFGTSPRVRSVYLPYDIGLLSRRFLRHFRPRLGIIMETELWPNLLLACRAASVPVLLANARLSARSAQRYARWPALTALTLGALDAVGAQTGADAERLAQLGARQVSVTGNIKFDIAPPPASDALAQTLSDRIGRRPVVLAASTREGEESLILDAFAAQAQPDTLLVLVPRHPQRFEEVATLVRDRGLSLQRRSENTTIDRATRVMLGDSMGEMFAYYRLADVALIGGSWLPFGGQNLIEASAVGTPALIGPHTFNFELVAGQAVAAGAALRFETVETAMAKALEIAADPRQQASIGEAGLAFSTAHRGATKRTLEIVERLLRAAQ
ncbi:MAG TPA: lipid IV(A) 3-deoxy-D-manno-octulosonic acid transferase [Azoarcus taiwanensis]|nr:lipid IV(A) 3-deoxy-D-manno-octulosonic acid transferase [Azoarcus taiwanensis]